MSRTRLVTSRQAWCPAEMDGAPEEISPDDLGERLAQVRLVPAADLAMEA